MTSKKKLVKKAIRNSKQYTAAELAYFRLWLSNKKKHRQDRKKQQLNNDNQAC
jgi:hypothetical protein